jgi:hypothetical protein
MDVIQSLLRKERDKIEAELIRLKDRLNEIDDHLTYFTEKPLSLGQLAKIINKLYKVEITSKHNTDKTTTKAKFEFSYIAKKQGFKLIQIADFLDTTSTGVSYQIKQYENKLYLESLKNKNNGN